MGTPALLPLPQNYHQSTRRRNRTSRTNNPKNGRKPRAHRAKSPRNCPCERTRWACRSTKSMIWRLNSDTDRNRCLQGIRTRIKPKTNEVRCLGHLAGLATRMHSVFIDGATLEYVVYGGSSDDAFNETIADPRGVSALGGNDYSLGRRDV